MYDKTIFEAAACGTLPVVSNKNLRGEFDERLLVSGHSVEELAAKLKVLLELEPTERRRLGETVRDYVESHHSLSMLAEKLFHDELV
jgi:glycosyltransferase involved in cell wall biosynthesis